MRGGVTRTRGYNSYRQLYTISDPERGQVVLGYDGAGNVRTIQSGGLADIGQLLSTVSALEVSP